MDRERLTVLSLRKAPEFWACLENTNWLAGFHRFCLIYWTVHLPSYAKTKKDFERGNDFHCFYVKQKLFKILLQISFYPDKK